MAFIYYTIIPLDGSVIIDSVTYANVSMNGIPNTVHAIQWNGVNLSGTIEYRQLPNGTIPASGSFSDPNDYYNQIQACEFPLVCYSTSDGSTYDGITYELGDQLIISQWPNPAVPAGFTENAPPISGEPFSVDQWTGTSWVTAPFPYDYTLSQAQLFLTSLVNTNASNLVSSQLRNVSYLQLVTAVDPSLLLPAGSVTNLYPTIGAYQTAVSSEIAPQLAFINAATNVTQLYDFDPTVEEPPVY